MSEFSDSFRPNATTAGVPAEENAVVDTRKDQANKESVELGQEEIIRALEKRLAVLKSKANSKSGLSVSHDSEPEGEAEDPFVIQATEEGKRLLKHAASFANGNEELHVDRIRRRVSASDLSEDEDGEAMTLARQVSLKFNPVVRIGGGIRHASSSHTYAKSTLAPVKRGREASLGASSRTSPALSVEGTPAPSRSVSRRASVISANSTGELSSSLPRSVTVLSGASSPCSSVVSSILAPLMPTSSLAPSPSRTLKILYTSQNPSGNTPHTGYKALILDQRERKMLSQKHSPLHQRSCRPHRKRRRCLPFPFCLPLCSDASEERRRLLEEEEDSSGSDTESESEDSFIKDELDVRFGTRRYLTWTFWRWKIGRVLRKFFRPDSASLEENESYA